MLVQLVMRIVARIKRGRYYSINQLDQQLEQLLDFDGGYFVELGANDGVTQSNSLYFERRRGWRGLLVEPVPHNYLKCRQNRADRTVVYCAACVPFDYDKEFVRLAYANLMSTPLGLDTDLSDPLAHAASGTQFLPKGQKVVEFGAVAKPLNALLEAADAPRNIDFLSLDVEGAELDVLRGIDHSRYRFRFILTESRDMDRISRFLSDQGYRFVRKLSGQDYLFESIDETNAGNQ